VTFTVTATGPSLTYQWYRDLPTAGDNFVLIGGATSATYGFTAAAGDNGNSYRCTVTNPAGSPTSNPASLTVVVAPVITLNPVSVQVNVGQPASFTIAATGGGLTYEWRRNNGPISGAPNSPTYSIAATVAGDHTAQFSCRVFNLANQATSSAAVLSVVTAPSITQNPSNAVVQAGQTATFQVQASGLNLAYQWQVDLPANGDAFMPISGANSSSYSFTATAGDDGNRYRCSVSNSVATVPSGAGLLTVVFTPSITQNPSNQTVTAPASATFQVAAIGGGLTYQWQFATPANPTNYANVNNATSAVLTFTTNTAMSGNRYRCRVTNSVGPAVISGFATLTVNGTPTFTTHPMNYTANVGQNAPFEAVASGVGQITYQWRRAPSGSGNFSDIPGATNPSLTLSGSGNDTEPGFDGYQYRCRATNSFGSTDSSIATLSLTLDFDHLYSLGPFATCVGCHSTAAQASNGALNLGTVADALHDLKTEMVTVSSCAPNGRRVQAGSSTNSLLHKRITASTCGAQMGTSVYGSLTGIDKTRIKFWIDTGAN